METDAVPQRVQVAVRLRPLGPGASSSLAPLTIEDESIRVEVAPLHSFKFDAVLGMEVTQSMLYERLVSPLVNVFLSGINATVFAYGQTGSGKTYTMGTGLESTSFSLSVPGAEEGLVSRSIIEIFQKLSLFNTAISFTLYASFIEIYNERVKDLLVSSNNTSLLIREDTNGDIYLAGCHEEQVSAPDDLFKLIRRGTLARATSSTDMNASSSRSHAIISLILRQKENEGKAKISRFHFVDLAGSERLKRTNAKGERVKEAISINGGLLALGNVISALSAGRCEHIPYRDSKLTRLLQNALGGNSCTLMIACIAPDEASLGESINTLKYAARAKNIRNTAKVNTDAPGSAFEIAQLKKQIMNLKKENLELRTMARMGTPMSGDGPEPPLVAASVENTVTALRASYEAKIAFLQQALASSHTSTQIPSTAGGSNTLSKTLREKYEGRIRELNKELSAAKSALAKASHSSNIMSRAESQEIQLLSHQLSTVRSTLQSTRLERSRCQQQQAEEMARLRAAYEQREAELRQLKIAEREHKEEVVRLRRALDYARSLVRKKNSTGPSRSNIASPHHNLLQSPVKKKSGREKENNISLPVLSPQTLQRRSAFIIAPLPITEQTESHSKEEKPDLDKRYSLDASPELSSDEKTVIPMDCSNEVATEDQQRHPVTVFSLFNKITSFTRNR